MIIELEREFNNEVYNHCVEAKDMDTLRWNCLDMIEKHYSVMLDVSSIVSIIRDSNWIKYILRGNRVFTVIFDQDSGKVYLIYEIRECGDE